MNMSATFTNILLHGLGMITLYSIGAQVQIYIFSCIFVVIHRQSAVRPKVKKTGDK